mgnify:CR=1 FL=1
MKTKKQFLKSYLLQQSKINRLYDMRENDPLSTAQYTAQIRECQQLRIQIEEKIHDINDDLLSEILFQKYVCGKTLEEISFVINYSKRHTERLHIKALKALKI